MVALGLGPRPDSATIALQNLCMKKRHLFPGAHPTPCCGPGLGEQTAGWISIPLLPWLDVLVQRSPFIVAHAVAQALNHYIGLPKGLKRLDVLPRRGQVGA